MTIIAVMVAGRKFSIIYHERLREHLHHIERKHHSLIRRAIEEQLVYEPAVPTKNRKPIRQPFRFAATWEIRCGPGNRFRIFYEIDQANYVVNVLAIGEKDGNLLLIAGEEVLG